jgi:hypothetical protein
MAWRGKDEGGRDVAGEAGGGVARPFLTFRWRVVGDAAAARTQGK